MTVVGMIVIARSDSDEAIQLRFRRTVKWIASLALAMRGKNFSVRHSGMVRRTRPGIWRFPDAQLRIGGSRLRPGMTKETSPPHQPIGEIADGLAIDRGPVPLAHRLEVRTALAV